MTGMTKDIYLSGKELTQMVQLLPKDVGRYAVVPGPRDRLKGILAEVEKPVKNFSFMEYEMHTGHIDGVKATFMNGGRYSADTAITTELLCAVEIPIIFRLGTCGALREDMKIGDVVVVENALSNDGVTPFYINDKNFEPKSDMKLVNEVVKAVESVGLKVHRGKVWSHDALLRQTRESVNQAIDQGCLASDMVSSTFLSICHLNKTSGVSILAVGDNVVKGEFGYLDTNFYMTEYMLTGACFKVIKNLGIK
ncbi:MAG: hypothetical protein KBD53_02260 [Candidatus Omnitrophica bacterium]|nr:hypothetical protein [Candidatus Omnitrophota bacterium]